MGAAHQPGWHPSIRRVTDSDGRHITLGVSASKKRGESATYTAVHRTTGDRLTIRKEEGGWAVTAHVKEGSPNRQYADDLGRAVLAKGLTRLADAAKYAR